MGIAYWLKSSMELYFGGHLVKKLNANSKSFKKYPDTRVIIDATEFFFEKPTSPCAQKATWSDY